MEALGGSSPQRTLSLLSACLRLSSGRRDLLRLWMFGGHRVWKVTPSRVSCNSPTFGVDYSKLFIWKSPYHTRIKWKIRFDLTVVCLVRIKVPNFLLFRTLAAMVALEFFWILVTLCAIWCYCLWFVCCCVLCCCNVAVVILVVVKFSVVFFGFLYCFTALFVGFFTVTNVTFSALYVWLCFPLYRVM